MKGGMKRASQETTGEIRQIRQMLDGNMLITVKRDQRKAGQVREMLTKMTGGTIKARVSAAGRRGGGVSLHVKGMNVITTQAEVMEAICAQSGAKRETARVGELWPFHGSSQGIQFKIPCEILKWFIVVAVVC